MYRMLAALTGRDPAEISGSARLEEDLGLSSLDKVDLLAQLEDRLGVRLDEALFTSLNTVDDLQSCVYGKTPSSSRSGAEARQNAGADRTALTDGVSRRVAPPRWNRSLPVSWARRTALNWAVLPILRRNLTLTVSGLDALMEVEPPVLFAANHESHLDTPVILASLPPQWRHRVAPAMSQAFFRPYFEPKGFSKWRFLWFGMQYLAAAGLFQAYPLSSRMGGIRESLRYSGELVEHGLCPLVFPEGQRTPDGRMQPFRPGIGLMAVRLQVPVVPVRLEGLFEIFSMHHRRPRRGRASVIFGRALTFGPQEPYAEAASAVEQAVRSLPPVSL